MTFLAMGKNEAVHIQFEDRSQWLVNTGRSFPNSQAEWLIAPYLRSRGIRHLSGLILTDWYQKHCGGVPSILRDFVVDYVFSPRLKKEKSRKNLAGYSGKPNRVFLKAGDRIGSEKTGEILVLDETDGQLILKVSFRGRDFLILPAFNRGIVMTLERHRKLLKNVEHLFLPASSQMGEEDLERLSELVDPSAITVVQAGPEIVSFARDRDILLADLKKSGAVSIVIPPQDSSLAPHKALVALSSFQGSPEKFSV
jgi:hypothetical protein